MHQKCHNIFFIYVNTFFDNLVSKQFSIISYAPIIVRLVRFIYIK